MIIGACSYGSSGSSAASDYLAEFDGTQVLDRTEFTWVSAPDSLVCLEFHLMHPHGRTNHSALALRRYMDFVKVRARAFHRRFGVPESEVIASAQRFIDAITDAMWSGYIPDNRQSFLQRRVGGRLMKGKVIPKLERRLGHTVRLYPMQDVRLSMCNPNFYPAARRHVRELLEMMGADFSKKIVLDQAFPGNAPEVCFPFYEDPRAVVVDRDPRDMFVFGRTKLLGLNHFMPVDSVEAFVNYYRCLRRAAPSRDDRILRLRFEDLVYNYDETTARLRAFCELPENPRPKSIFKPEQSLGNTQVFRRFPQFSREVAFIEEQLPEYLFDFDRYGDVSIPERMFYGRAHKS